MSYLFSVNRYLDLSGAVDGWAGKLAGGSLGYGVGLAMR